MRAAPRAHLLQNPWDESRNGALTDEERRRVNATLMHVGIFTPGEAFARPYIIVLQTRPTAAGEEFRADYGAAFWRRARAASRRTTARQRAPARVAAAAAAPPRIAPLGSRAL